MLHRNIWKRFNNSHMKESACFLKQYWFVQNTKHSEGKCWKMQWHTVVVLLLLCCAGLEPLSFDSRIRRLLVDFSLRLVVCTWCIISGVREPSTMTVFTAPLFMTLYFTRIYSNVTLFFPLAYKDLQSREETRNAAWKHDGWDEMVYYTGEAHLGWAHDEQRKKPGRLSANKVIQTITVNNAQIKYRNHRNPKWFWI